MSLSSLSLSLSLSLKIIFSLSSLSLSQSRSICPYEALSLFSLWQLIFTFTPKIFMAIITSLRLLDGFMSPRQGFYYFLKHIYCHSSHIYTVSNWNIVNMQHVFAFTSWLLSYLPAVTSQQQGARTERKRVQHRTSRHAQKVHRFQYRHYFLFLKKKKKKKKYIYI